MAKPKKRVVACYARVSTSSKEQASSFENQQSFFQDYIKRSNNYKLHKIYADPGISGTLFKREKFEEMLYDAGLDLTINKHEAVITKQLNDLSDQAEGKPSTVHYINYTVLLSDREPKFDEILVRNTSRFARNIEVDVILKRLRLKGVYVRFLDIDKTTEKEEDISIIQLFQTFDELFVRDLSRKVLAGNERSVANKVLRSHPKLYGYKYIPRPNLQENNKLTPIPHEAEVIQKIFRLYNGCFNPDEPFIGCDFACKTCTLPRTAGLGIRRVINYLTAEGLKPRPIKDKNGKVVKNNNFGKTTINRILANEKYAGYINTGKYTSGTIFNKLTTPTVKDEYLLELDPVNIEKPIISPELFYSCEAIRESRLTKIHAKGKSPARSAYGGGFLVCGKCKSNYQHNVDRGNPFYLCGLKKSKGSSHCNSANVSEAYVTQYLQDLLSGGLSLYLYRDYQEALVSTLNALNRRLEFISRNRDEDKLQDLYKSEAQYDKRLTNLYTRLADEDGDTTTLDNLILNTKNLLSETRVELDKYTKKPLQYLEEADTLLTIATTLYTELDNLSQNIRQEYTQADLAAVDHLVVHGTSNQLGGKPSPVALTTVLAKDPELETLLSAEEPDLKTYKPLRFKPEVRRNVSLNLDYSANLKTTTKKEADAISTDPTNIQLLSLTALKDSLTLLSETLQSLQELY
jgi:site-specific DNA recombinase